MRASPRTGSALLPWLAGALLLVGCTPPSLNESEWQRYRARFLDQGRIVDRDNGDVSHSESQGYGLLFAESAGNRDDFEQIWRWTQQTLQREDGLFSWRYRPCPSRDRACIDDPNNASDGDLLIAWALLRAGQRWGDRRFVAEAQRISAAVAANLLVEDHGYLLLLPGAEGFVTERNGQPHYRLNPSYWLFPALRAFAGHFGPAPWRQLARDGERLLAAARFGAPPLHPDWFTLGPDGPYLGDGYEPVYGYNACRVPLHIAWGRRKSAEIDALLAPYRELWSQPGPLPAWINLVSGRTAPYPASTGMRAIANWLRGLPPASLVDTAPTEDDNSYYAASLQLLTRLAALESNR